MKTFFLYNSLIVIFISFSNLNCQSGSFKLPKPQFTDNTIAQANQQYIYKKASLTTVLFKAEATTYSTAQPISYSIIEDNSHFQIDSASGVVRLFYPLLELESSLIQFTIVATDSAPLPDTQRSYLSVSVVVLDPDSDSPKFNLTSNNNYISISELVDIGSIIYNNIVVTHAVANPNNTLSVVCDRNDLSNSDASLSCDYFDVKCDRQSRITTKCSIILMRRLDFSTKSGYILTIKAQGNDDFLDQSTKTYFQIDVIDPKLNSPYFSNSNYFITATKQTPIGANVLTLEVKGVVLQQQNGVFSVKDPKGYFDVNGTMTYCTDKHCIGYIQLVKPLQFPVKYKLDVVFSTDLQQITTRVYVFINNIKYSVKPPVFSQSSYDVSLRSTKAGSVIQDAKIFVYEPEQLSVYKSGFLLSVLDPVSSLETSLFEFVQDYGKGKLYTNIRLKQDIGPNAPSRFEYRLKASSTSNDQISSYANLIVNVKNMNQLRLSFNSTQYKTILNYPDNLNKFYYVTSVVARYSDSSVDPSEQSLTYSILGESASKFWIDGTGRVYLTQSLLVSDFKSIYSLPIQVYDNKAGLSDFTVLSVYLNSISESLIKLSFQIETQISELSTDDMQTLEPPMFIPVNSNYMLEYSIKTTDPYFSEIKINSTTGQVYITAPIVDNTISKITITIQVSQYQLYDLTTKLYLSSDTCTAIILLATTIDSNMDKRPYFLRQTYRSTVSREWIFTNVQLMTIHAVSANNGQVRYAIVGNPSTLYEDQFYIDSSSGVIFPKQNLSLPIGIYNLTISATDSIDGSKSYTNVLIKVIQSTTSKLECDTSYLSIRVPSDDSNLTTELVIGSLNCRSNSNYQEDASSYSIGRPLAVYDCLGRQVNDYTPNIGIGSKNGVIYALESLNQKNFCHAFYLIQLYKGQSSISVPFHLIVTPSVDYGSPVFYGDYTNPLTIPFYAHNDAFVANLIAYDAKQKQLIEKFELDKSKPMSQFFTVDPTIGTLRLTGLQNLTNMANSQLSVNAIAPNGLTTPINLNIDFSSYISALNSLQFDQNTNDTIYLDSNRIYREPIYTTSATCRNTILNLESSQCENVVYNLTFIKNLNFSDFAKDNAENIYLTTPLVYDQQNQVKYVFTLNAYTDSIKLDRLNRMTQKAVTVIVRKNPLQNETSTSTARFEFPSYNLNVLDTTPADTILFVVKYFGVSDGFALTVEQKSTPQVDDFFTIQNRPDLQAVLVSLKTSELRKVNKELFSFVLRLQNDTTSGSTLVNITILSSTDTSISFIEFQRPSTPNQNVPIDLSTIGNNSVVYTLEAGVSNNDKSKVGYRLVNAEQNKEFYIDGNRIRFLQLDDNQSQKQRSEALLFIEAKDTNNDSVVPSYTTLNIQFSNQTNEVISLRPYFDFNQTSNLVYFQLPDNVPVGTALVDLKQFLVSPDPNATVNFYLFKTAYPYDEVKTFGVKMSTLELVLQRKLNYSSVNKFIFYVYATYDNLTTVNALQLDRNETRADLMLVYIDVQSTNEFAPLFTDYTEIIFIEQSYEAFKKIGYVRAKDNDLAKPNNQIDFKLQQCVFEHLATGTPVSESLNCSSIFEITKTGDIFLTHLTDYDAYVNGVFRLVVNASDCGSPHRLSRTVDLKAYVIPKTDEGSQFVIKLYSNINFVKYLEDLKRSINAALDDYYFDYVSYTITGLTDTYYSQLKVCFYLMNRKTNCFTPYMETRKLFLKNKLIQKIFEAYSISELKRCNNFYETEKDTNNYYHTNGKYKIHALAIGFIAVISLMLLFTILSIILLICCWSSHMKYALLVPQQVPTPYGSSHNLLG